MFLVTQTCWDHSLAFVVVFSDTIEHQNTAVCINYRENKCVWYRFATFFFAQTALVGSTLFTLNASLVSCRSVFSHSTAECKRWHQGTFRLAVLSGCDSFIQAVCVNDSHVSFQLRPRGWPQHGLQAFFWSVWKMNIVTFGKKKNKRDLVSACALDS